MTNSSTCLDPDIAASALRLRQMVLAMAVQAGGAHLTPAYSIIDLLTVIYARHLNLHPGSETDPDRDRLVLSKGHGCAALYAILAERGFFPVRDLKGFCSAGSKLGGHPDMHKIPGVEASTGSLGHGFCSAIGMALAAKLQGRSARTFAILGDGECQEGSIWEGAMAAAQLELGNLLAIVDANGLQGMGRVENINTLEPLCDKWSSFGWDTMEIDGHDHAAIDAAITRAFNVTGRPTVLIARTIKGKGVSYMEGEAIWHYRLPNETELEQACAQLGIDDLNSVLT